MSWAEVEVAEAAEMLEKGGVRLVDCREEDEFAICKIDGAELIPLSIFGFEATTRLPDKQQQILIYCHHGRRSLTAANYLAERGYTQVMSLRGGIEQWASELDSSMTRY